MATPAPEPLHERLRRLRDERQLSRSQLSRATVAYDNKGLAEVTIKALENGRSQPTPATIEAVAYALDVTPDEFPEYRLALARQLLDEREVGLDQALRTLERFEIALQTAELVAPREEQRTASSRRRAPKDAGASRSRRAT